MLGDLEREEAVESSNIKGNNKRTENELCVRRSEARVVGWFGGVRKSHTLGSAVHM